MSVNKVFNDNLTYQLLAIIDLYAIIDNIYLLLQGSLIEFHRPPANNLYRSMKFSV